jgi:hypothetical protein
MKIKLLFLFSILFSVIGFSQSYRPLLKEGNKWYEKHLEYHVGWPSPIYRSYIFINGEETKNGIVYKKLFSNLYCYASDVYNPCVPTGNPDVFYKLLREDVNERKIYYYDEETDSDVLLYDFSLNEGDTHPSNFPFVLMHSGYGDIIIDKIVQGTVFDIDVKAFEVNRYSFYNNSQTRIYEGIGSDAGLLYNPGFSPPLRPSLEPDLDFDMHWLECFEDTESGKSCQSNFVLSLKENPVKSAFSLIRTTNRDVFKIIGKSQEKLQVQFYDFSGKLLETKNVNSNEDFYLNNISQNGIFLYKITSSNSIMTGKIVIP